MLWWRLREIEKNIIRDNNIHKALEKGWVIAPCKFLKQEKSITAENMTVFSKVYKSPV